MKLSIDSCSLEYCVFGNRCRDANSRAEFEKLYGPRIWRAAPKVYEYVTKVEPTRRALEELRVDAWMTGRRRSQGGERERLPLLELDESDGRLKMNPLSNWPLKEVFFPRKCPESASLPCA